MQTMQEIIELKLSALKHPPYSPDLAPSDFYFFNRMKKEMRGHHFSDAEAIKTFVNEWIHTLDADFFINAFDELVKRWEKCISVNGNFIEK